MVSLIYRTSVYTFTSIGSTAISFGSFSMAATANGRCFHLEFLRPCGFLPVSLSQSQYSYIMFDSYLNICIHVYVDTDIHGQQLDFMRHLRLVDQCRQVQSLFPPVLTCSILISGLRNTVHTEDSQL